MLYQHDAVEELTREEMDLLLQRARYGRLGLAFENESYVVPVSHFYDAQAIRFHIGKAGKKTTYLQANPQACFEVDEWTEHGWCSVICYGTVTLSDSVEAKREFFKLCGVAVPPDDRLEEMRVYACTMSIDEMTGRRSTAHSA
jgi:nitroimidazol reductase NimA-like FMN-containing flavoprotein (pyridoxamine 5'-phosphate oxidase superfamily)